MTLITTLQWLLKCVFTCNHGRTAPKEGKCFCPDCGQGVIFQWVVMRCESCNHRADSRLLLRQLTPSQRCCANCGQASFYYDYLDDPSYFQLHRARLVVREEADYLQGRHQGNTYAFTEQWQAFTRESFRYYWDNLSGKAAALLAPQAPLAPALIACQSPRSE